MPRVSGGAKRSSWLTFQRRLFLVRQLFRGPARAADLIAAARVAFDADIYPPDARAALRHDFAALRTEFDCSIEYAAAVGYRLVGPGRLATLDLPDAELEALAFLRATFADGDMPNAEAVEALLDRIVGLLPPERRRQLPPHAARPRIDRPATLIAPAEELLAPLKRAVGRQRIAFAYRSSYAAGAALGHIVAPYDLLYRDGHIYLDAHCYTCDDQAIDRSILYRVDRIVPGSLRVLPMAPPHIIIEIGQLEAELRELTAQRQRSIIRDRLLATEQRGPAPGLLLLIGPTPALNDPQAQSANDAIDFHRSRLQHCWLIASGGEHGSLARAYELRDYYTRRRIQLHVWQIEDATSIQETYALVDWLYRYHIPAHGLAEAQVIADITGATKPMTVGMVLACGARRRMQYMMRQTQGPSLPLLLRLTDAPGADLDPGSSP